MSGPFVSALALILILVVAALVFFTPFLVLWEMRKDPDGGGAGILIFGPWAIVNLAYMLDGAWWLLQKVLT